MGASLGIIDGLDGSADRLRLFGSPLLQHGRTRLVVPHKAFCLFALLLMAADRSLARPKLRGILFGSSGQVQANANLRQLLSRVQRLQRGAGISLINLDGVDVVFDGAEFEVDLRDWIDGDPAGLVRAARWDDLHAILVRCSGELLEGIETDDEMLDEWLTRERERMRTNWIAAASALLDSDAIADDRLLEMASRSISADPLSEAAYRARMRVHGRRGNKAEARDAFRQIQKLLLEDLGTTPSEATLAVAAALFPAASPSLAPIVLPPAPAAVEPRTTRPRVAILPLAFTDDPTERRIGDALLEDVTIGLSRYRSFRIIAAHTSLRFATEERLRLGAGWCEMAVFSSAQRRPGGMEIRYRLTDANTDEVLWSSEIVAPDHQPQIIFRELSARVVAGLADAVDKTELALPQVSSDPSAYRLFLEGRRCLRTTDLQDFRRARKFFRESLRHDDSFAAPHAGVARALSMEWLLRGAPGSDLLQEACDLSQKAIERDPHDARGYRELGFASLYAQRHDESLSFFDQAIARNPNDADLLADMADSLAHSGDPRAGLEAVNRAVDLNPLPPAYYYWIGGSIHYQLGDYEAGLRFMRPVQDRPATARLMAACSAQAGDLAAARRYAAMVRETYPDFRTEQLWRIVPNRDRRDTEHLISGLRRAGLD